jgi:hypothetical protein
MESGQYIKRNLRPRTEHVTRMYHLIEQYEANSDMYVSRTLDQSYYDGMDNTEYRDSTQVVYRYTEEKTPEEVRLLMVNKLWLWMIDKSK